MRHFPARPFLVLIRPYPRDPLNLDQSGYRLAIYRGPTDIAITKDGVSRCPYSRIMIKRK